MASTANSPTAPLRVSRRLKLGPRRVFHDPSPHPFDSTCGCYVCSLRAFNARFPFPGFADYHLAATTNGSSLLTTSCGAFWFACRPGQLIQHGVPVADPWSGNSYLFVALEAQLPTTAVVPSQVPWFEVPERRAKVLASYVHNPYPTTDWEKRLHVRPVQLVDFDRECRHSELIDIYDLDDFICDERKDEIGIPLTDPMLRCSDDMENEANADVSSDSDSSGDPEFAADYKGWHRVIDFDMIDAAGSCHRLRMTWRQYKLFLLGWGATVRDRSSGQLVGFVDDSGSGSLITCVDNALLAAFVPHDNVPAVADCLPFVGPNGERLAYKWEGGMGSPGGEREYTSHEHQVELLFEVASRMGPSCFDTRFDTPQQVRVEMRAAFLQRAFGASSCVLPREVLLLIAEYDPAIIYWSHLGGKPPLVVPASDDSCEIPDHY
ncbi:hypothetical protein HDU90_004147 [Geranomyces variabilis]|nr:hypothetical protein HDU90_004147 [Geranomyces variabilis]